MTRYVLRPLAKRDIAKIWDYSCEKWGESQAEIYVRQIQTTFDIIALSPRLGRRCDYIRQGYFKHTVGSHVIFYRIANDDIEVVRILHERMDFIRHL